MTVCVGELQRAWAAVERGDFRGDTGEAQISQWEFAEQTLLIVGAEHRVGATTVALALAEGRAVKTRLVEVAPPAESGLTAAPAAELRRVAGWCRGSRGSVMIERPENSPEEQSELRPLATDAEVTIVDAGAFADAARGPLGALLRSTPTVVVAVATAPGLRRLSAVLTQLEPAAIVVRGPGVKRWPAVVWAEVTPQLRAVIEGGRLHSMPTDRRLAVSGLTPGPLPRAVREAVAGLAAQLGEGVHDAQQ